MGDNIEVIDRLAVPKTFAADEVAGLLWQCIKLGIGADGAANFVSGGAGATDAGTIRTRAADDDPISAGGTTVVTSIQRPNDTTTYTAGDSWSNSTATPTAAVMQDASRGAGKSGHILDIILTAAVRPGLLLTGDLWIFDSALATPLYDNAPWALTSADLDKVVDVVPFTMVTTGSSVANSYCRLPGLNIGFTTIGSAHLHLIPKVTNAYVPSANEILKVKAKILRNN